MMQGYMTAKAEMLLERGIEVYRKGDYFAQPPEDLDGDEQQALQTAAQQLVDGRGFSAEQPLTHIGVNHVYILLHCFHFKVLRHDSELDESNQEWCDHLLVQHVMTEQQVSLYSRALKTSVRNPESRRAPVFERPALRPRLQYAPHLKDFKIVETGRIGPFPYQLRTNCVAHGSIEYKHVLFCYDPNRRWLCYVVAAERFAGDPEHLDEEQAKWMLCEFLPPVKHRNFGDRERLYELKIFTAVALEMAEKYLLDDG